MRTAPLGSADEYPASPTATLVVNLSPPNPGHLSLGCSRDGPSYGQNRTRILGELATLLGGLYHGKSHIKNERDRLKGHTRGPTHPYNKVTVGPWF